MTPEEFALVSAIVAGTPALPDAACRGLAPAFDASESRHATTVPLAVCRRCPELPACSAWIAHQPADQRPVGVVAGQVLRGERPQGNWGPK